MLFQPSQEMKEILSSFPNLYDLDFEFWSPGYWKKVDGKIPEEIKRAYVKDWELVCPKLISVSFVDGSILKKAQGEWTHSARPLAMAF